MRDVPSSYPSRVRWLIQRISSLVWSGVVHHCWEQYITRVGSGRRRRRRCKLFHSIMRYVLRLLSSHSPPVNARRAGDELGDRL